MPHGKLDFSTKTWIDINNEDEILYWSKRFHVTPKELLEAMAQMGKTVKYIQNYLERKLING
jgi:Protein of unknown function (DUF3606)